MRNSERSPRACSNRLEFDSPSRAVAPPSMVRGVPGWVSSNFDLSSKVPLGRHCSSRLDRSKLRLDKRGLYSSMLFDCSFVELLLPCCCTSLATSELSTLLSPPKSNAEEEKGEAWLS